MAYAAKTCVDFRLTNSGQSCVAAKRFIVVESVFQEFQDAFLKEFRSRKVGDPRDLTTEVGPLARRDLSVTLHKQVQESQKQGATLLLGGNFLDQKGFFYAPTILSEVTSKMCAFEEETFGPLAALVRAENEAHAFDLANLSQYGLGAAIFSTDIERAQKLAETRLECGICAINTGVKSDPRLPFGGVKNSGFGRELGKAGILEFVNLKTIVTH